MAQQYESESQRFIGFGLDTAESPLAIKTHPRWCLRAEWQKKDRLLEGTHES